MIDENNENYGENTNEVHQIIEISIDDAITELLPIQNILETYLGGDMMDSEGEEEEEEEDEQLSDYDDTSQEKQEEETLEGIKPETSESPESPEDSPKEPNKIADFFENPELDEIKKVPINGGKFEERAQNPPDANIPNPQDEKPKESFFDDIED